MGKGRSLLCFTVLISNRISDACASEPEGEDGKQSFDRQHIHSLLSLISASRQIIMIGGTQALRRGLTAYRYHTGSTQ